ncbi:MAG: hypothetical protein PHQ04_02240 [Opitutaceae bacterium]|nr:hypothetical protein [Opitutaceae bacterium]
MRRDRWLALGIGTGVFLLLVGFCLSRFFPPLPAVLNLEVRFSPGSADSLEPIICTGTTGNGDILRIRYLDDHTVRFEYDSWGVGGPVSPPLSIAPKTRHRLQIELPSVAGIVGSSAASVGRLRLRCDGVSLLDAAVPFHYRQPQQIYFGEDPIGGTCGPVFRGALYREDGRVLRGGPAAYFPVGRSLLPYWVTQAPWQVLVVVLLSLAAGYGGAAAIRWLRMRLPALLAPATPSERIPPWRWFLLSLVICAAAFTHVLTYGRWQIIYPEEFGSFFDYQAASLLQGHLNVPPDVLSGEAFIFEGKAYGYFGPTPALLRLPFVLFNIAFGEWSRMFMLGELLASLIAAYLILNHVYTLTSGRGTHPSRSVATLFILNIGLGSTLFFLSSRAYIYHEVILCGVAFALASCYFTLRYSATPERRWWIGALVCGTLSVHARPPVGLFALSLLGASALAVLLREMFRAPSGVATAKDRRLPADWGKHVAVGLLCVTSTLSFNGLSYLKFKSFDGAPLKYHVQYDAKRLARIEGKNFHLSNVPLNFGAYLLHPKWVFRPSFPYVYAQGHSPSGYPQAKIDLAEPMLGLPFAMPGLFYLATGGVLGVFVYFRQRRLDIAVLILGVLPMALAMFAAVATSQRYTGDFCPFLICAAAYGGAVIDTLPRRLRHLALTLGGALTLAAILVTLALTLHYQGEGVWGVPDDVRQHYQDLRLRVDNWIPFPHHASK